MNDEQFLLFRKILNIRNYSESTINNYLNAIVKFKKWNVNLYKINKDSLFKYVECLKAKINSQRYSYHTDLYSYFISQHIEN